MDNYLRQFQQTDTNIQNLLYLYQKELDKVPPQYRASQVEKFNKLQTSYQTARNDVIHTLYDAYNNEAVQMGEAEYSNRITRLRSNQMTLYHQTDSEAAAKIAQSGKMLRGSTGLAGGGIYFATSKEHTQHKALHFGKMLTCNVMLGNVKVISKYGDSSITFKKLISEGYDSVCIPRDNGYEYVVYNHDQVSILNIA